VKRLRTNRQMEEERSLLLLRRCFVAVAAVAVAAVAAAKTCLVFY